MVEYLVKNQIDIIKYDRCVSKSINSRIYGYSWYLDAVCDDWDLLILDDYAAVMPLPKRKKYGVNYIYQAPWIQQLGVFSEYKIELDIFHEFINKIPRKFKLIDIMLNAANDFSSRYSTSRNNFVLPLENKNYQTLQRKYSKGRKSSVRQAQKFELIIRNATTVDNLVELFRLNKGTQVEKTEQEYFALHKLVNKGLQLRKIDIYEIFNKSDVLVGGAVFLKDENRITYLFSALNDEGRKKQAMSFLIDFVIKRYSEKSMMLDFEGSMISEIASFYKSFGAEKEIYYQYKKYRL